MAFGDQDSIFDNLQRRPVTRTPLPGQLPGSPGRPAPPPVRGARELAPVNPLDVIGGLQHLGAEAAGNAAANVVTHTPFDYLMPGSAPPVPQSLQESAQLLGRDITARIEQPGEGGVKPGSVASAAQHLAPIAPVVATGWAPSAWKRLTQLKQENPDKGDFIDGLAQLTPDQVRAMPPYSSAANNAISDSVLNAHNDDLSLVDRVRGGSPYASIQLREMRGQPFNDPGSATSASVPWNTFSLKQPDMPPFPANDPRGPGRPPGTTLNTPPPDQQQPFY